MRISDWSSDVCSSDLVEQVLDRKRELHVRKHAATLAHVIASIQVDGCERAEVGRRQRLIVGHPAGVADERREHEVLSTPPHADTAPELRRIEDHTTRLALGLACAILLMAGHPARS